MSNLTDRIAMAMSAKTDDELYAYIDNREKYLPETVETALAELKARGAEFSDEELDVISQDMQARREMARDELNLSIFATKAWKYKLVDDEFAPQFYSQMAITIFSILFGILFGSVMMAVNISKTENSAKSFIIVLYGLAFTAVQILITQGIGVGGSGFSIVASVLGAFYLTSYFWTRYLGNGTLYKQKPIWVPLVIALVIMVPFMYQAIKLMPKK